MPEPRTFSPAHLREERTRANLNREALAYAIGRTVVSVGNYERGATTSPPDALDQIARVLRCSRDDLLEPDGVRAG